MANAKNLKLMQTLLKNGRLFFLLPAMFWAFSATAQEETLFQDWDVVGAFGGPFIEIGAINGEVSGNVGGGGALVLEDFFLGGYGLGSRSPRYTVDDPETGDAINYRIRFKHGGLWLGYAHRQHKVAHLYTSLRIGWGRARLDDAPAPEIDDRVFVLTPELGVEFNVFKFFKLALSGGYRWVNGVTQLPGLGNSDFGSPIGMVTFRFGGFGDYSDWDKDWD